jgi:CRISPR-associated protein Cas5h
MTIPVLVFKVKGQFGHWRKWFTTVSPLTYSFPPRTAIVGLIGAILGIQRDDIPQRFPLEATYTAVCPLEPIIKDRLPQNWYQSPVRIIRGRVSLDKTEQTFQANLEVIRRPCYCIVFWHKEKSLMRELTQRLKEKRWFYPPYLGILGFLADVEFEAEDEAEEVREREIELHSVLPLSISSSPVELDPSRNYIREERIPLEVFPGRLFKYLDVAYIESTAQPLHITGKEGDIRHFNLKTKNWKVIFLEP